MNSITDVKTCFHCNQKVNKLNSTKKNSKSDLDKVSTKLYLMEMDIGANNCPCQCFSCFLTLKFHNFLSIKNISSEETFDKISFYKTRFYTQTLVKWSWYSNASRKSFSYILSHSLKSHRDQPDQEKQLLVCQFSFLINMPP